MNRSRTTRPFNIQRARRARCPDTYAAIRSPNKQAVVSGSITNKKVFRRICAVDIRHADVPEGDTQCLTLEINKAVLIAA